MRDDVGSMVRRADEIDVADRDLGAAQTSRTGETLERRSFADVFHCFARDCQCLRERRAALASSIGKNAAPPISIVLLPKRGNPASVQAAIAASRSASEAMPYSAKSNVAVFVPMPLTPTPQERWREAPIDLFELFGLSATHELFDRGADRLPDAGKFEMLARGDQVG